MIVFCRSFVFGSCFLPIFCSWEIPRLTLRQENDQLIYSKNISHTVFFHQNGTDRLYVGGTNYVLELKDGVVLNNYTLTTNRGDACHESSCENVVTVIEEFQNSILVCGTNGEQPACWNLPHIENNQSRTVGDSTDGSGISPYTYSQNSLSLVVDGELYAAAPLYKDGSSLQFRRKAGKQIQVWMHDPWIIEPTFISAFVARRYDDPTNEKIYVLFREKNSDSSPEADPWISRVARICKCVSDSRSLPGQTIRVIKEHPEMTDWIYPIQKRAPFIISNNNYTKIAVDRVQAADDKMYNVVLLATDNGLILKILEHDFKAFIISETSLCKGSAPIQSMKLDSNQRKLFVGYPGQMSVLDLARCQDYNASCQDCVLARDPYCAWTENGCTSQIEGGIQNLSTGDPKICAPNPAPRRLKRQTPSESHLPIKLTVPESLPFYLTCPMESHHAIYSWIHNGISQPCQKSQFDCLYLIPAVSGQDYGVFSCVSVERNYEKVVKVYNLQDSPKQRSLSSALKLRAQKECFLAVFAVFFTVR
ncbi:semaphorin-7A isoform X2 [Trichomycterus rosablanca]|uniref:semaphorin-7A isoform X2 n=1 Tax=Trichomycterus rosablanca TaxID=2290929 RepID=UPI002F351E5D